MAEPRSAAASDGAPEAPGIAIGRNGRILLVDDNRAIHEDFRKVLGTDSGDSDLDALHEELFGAAEPSRAQRFELDSHSRATRAADGSAARRDGRPYALAFVDVRMPPGIDGVETTRRLLAEDADIGIVVLGLLRPPPGGDGGGLR
jgi:CheY-like chemotaxis protein